MRNTIISFAAGVVVASAVFLFLIGDDVGRQIESPGEATSIDVRRESPPPESIRQEPRANDAPEAIAPSAEPDLEQPVIPMPTPPEFEALLETRNGRQMHSHIEQEPLDPEWAPAMESHLQAHYSQKPEVTQYGVPTVHCRSETCEIQLVTYEENNLETGDWLSVLGNGITSQPWGEGLFPVGIVDVDDGPVSTVLLQLTTRVCRERPEVCGQDE